MPATHEAHATHGSPPDAPDVKWTPDAPLMVGMRRLHAALDGAMSGGRRVWPMTVGGAA